MALIDVWEITPHSSDRFDSWVSKVSDDPDGRFIKTKEGEGR